MAWLPGMNAYNVPVACGLTVCGYALTNYFHVLAGCLLALTLSLLFVTFNGWAYSLFTIVTVLIFVLGWEKYELLTGITTLRPELFGTIAQATSEGVRLINDTVNDIVGGTVGGLVTVAGLRIVDRHGSEVEA